MKIQSPRRPWSQRLRWPFLAVLLVAVAGLALVFFCLPQARQAAAAAMAALRPAEHAEDGHDHGSETGHCPDENGHEDGKQQADAPGEAGHDHEAQPAKSEADEGHEHEHEHEAGEGAHAEPADHKHLETETVRLSPNAQQNVGMQLAKVELRSFERTITVPGMIVERPGRSMLQIAAPLTGVVRRIRPLQGETVAPGQPLFDLRLTHEEVVEGQAQYLRTAEELDVVRREIERLEKVTANGAIAGKTLLERQYELQRLQGVFRAQRQGLLLHGLSEAQVDQIVSQRALVNEMTVFAPGKENDRGKAEEPCFLQIEELKVTEGQSVKVGDPLCVLSDHCLLYVQGKAFEQDAGALNKAAANDWHVKAVITGHGQDRQVVPDLPIMFLGNKVEPDSRAFLFYVELPNQVVRNHVRPGGHRFSSWQFRPGQRVELLVPVEQWDRRIVLPLGAIVEDGPESYVFEQNDGHFDRRSVRVEYRDQFSAVIADDGTLTPGKSVIVSGSYLVHLAMKNKAGGAPDPHAGHNH